MEHEINLYNTIFMQSFQVFQRECTKNRQYQAANWSVQSVLHT